jgi:hypothetical protein
VYEPLCVTSVAISSSRERLVSIIELRFDLSVTKAPLFDEGEKRGLTAPRQESVAVKNARKEVTAEPRFLRVVEQGKRAEQVSLWLADDEGKVLALAPVIPIEAELVHVGDDPPTR